MILEMRVYRCLPGRLPNLLKRFEDHTLKIWEKHGIRQTGFFTTVIGQSNQELTYFLNWDSLAGLLGGKLNPRGPSFRVPKQHPASRQPMRPKPSPIGIAKPAMSAAFQKGKRSRLSRNHAPIEAPMKPP